MHSWTLAQAVSLLQMLYMSLHSHFGHCAYTVQCMAFQGTHTTHQGKVVPIEWLIWFD